MQTLLLTYCAALHSHYLICRSDGGCPLWWSDIHTHRRPTRRHCERTRDRMYALLCDCVWVGSRESRCTCKWERERVFHSFLFIIHSYPVLLSLTLTLTYMEPSCTCKFIIIWWKYWNNITMLYHVLCCTCKCLWEREREWIEQSRTGRINPLLISYSLLYSRHLYTLQLLTTPHTTPFFVNTRLYVQPVLTWPRPSG